jgi:PAS domain S-box-containing protein
VTSGGHHALNVDALAWALGTSSSLAIAASADRTIVFANDAARTRWPDAIARTADALFPEDARAKLAVAEQAAHAGNGSTFEWGEHGPAGVRAWFLCTVSPLRADGGAVVGCLFVSTDITEQKRTELRLRRTEELMVDTQGVAHLGTWDWDITQPNATWSAELYRIYGLTPETYTPSYDAYLGMIHPDDKQRVMDATNRVFKEHVPYSHDERIFRPDGSMRYLHTWAHPVLDDAGTLRRLVGVCQDITDQKLAQQQVNRLNADLERRVAERTLTIENTMRDVEAFNATLSHDLRAPLSVIQLSCEVILRANGETLPPSVTDNLARIQRSTVFMTALVNDLLTLAHVGHATLERSPFELSKASEEILADLVRSRPERDVMVNVQPGLVCEGDPALMRAALENLLGNAWKYSSRVPVAHIEVGKHGARAFFVRDNGAGFDMKDASRLFAPFERLHKSSEFEGTGVGLAAVHRIIERHGGRIWAESEPGHGATFFFEL